MELPENRENIITTYEPKIESNENDTDEIVIRYMMNCCTAFISVLFAMIFIWCPIFLYFVVIRGGYKQVIVIDKKKKTLIIGQRGIFSCCFCCIFDKKTFFLNEIKNVKIQVVSQNDPSIGFGELYFINGYIYSQDDKCETLFENIEYTSEKYKNFVSFFKKYIPTIDDLYEGKKFPKVDDEYPSKYEINEDAAMPVSP